MRSRMALIYKFQEGGSTLIKKSIAKSVRLTQEVYDYIEQQAGNGFNEKFENIILEAKKGESDRKKELARLDREIEKQRKKEYLLFEKYQSLNNFFRDFLSVQHTLEKLKSQVEKAANLEKQMED